MILHSISPQHFGPFSAATKVALEKDITVFTGQNDAGKSSALLAIEVFLKRVKAIEDYINSDRHGNFQGPWNEDPEVRIVGEFEITQQSIDLGMIKGAVEAGDIVTCQFLPNKSEGGHQIQRVRRGGSKVATNGLVFRTLPKVVQLRSEATIRSAIDMANPSVEEGQFLRAALGDQFTANSFQSLSALNRDVQIRKAERRLGEKLKAFFPATMPFEFRLSDGGSGKTLNIQLIDGVSGHVPLQYRGSGVKKLLALMGLLLQEVDQKLFNVILLDEPENSLHADAQHQLRRVLEQLAANPNIQVVYATHSPSMLNPARPERVRVFSRATHNEVATSRVEVLNYGENFQRARVSLGLTPVDSLIYGLVTVVVEGDTEARCLGPLLRRLDGEGVDGFLGLTSMLDASHFVCGGGNSISYYCKLARDQNGRPIAFLDGDKRREAEALRRDAIPTIELPRDREFEQIVPVDRYIAAVAEEAASYEVPTNELTAEGYTAWLNAAGLPDGMMFSKRIDRWFEHVTGRSLNKHSVMERAIRLTPALDIDTITLRELADALRREFNPT